MMAQIQAGEIKVNQGTIYYEMAGEGTPLVLAHAGFVDSGMWEAQFEAFAQDYQVIRYDLAGYGKSSPATGPVSRREELLTVLEALEIDKAILVGCSLSGTTVLDFALDYPEKVLGLVIVSATPSGFEMQGEPPRYLFEMIGAMQGGDIDTAVELQTRIWFDGMFREPEQVDATIRGRVKVMNRIAVQNGTFFVADSQLNNPLDPPAVGRLAEIKVPALVVAGALDHPEILRAADVMVAEIPDSKKLVLADSAHVPNMEQAEAFNRAVLDFLRG